MARSNPNDFYLQFVGDEVGGKWNYGNIFQTLSIRMKNQHIGMKFWKTELLSSNNVYLSQAIQPLGYTSIMSFQIQLQTIRLVNRAKPSIQPPFRRATLSSTKIVDWNGQLANEEWPDHFAAFGKMKCYSILRQIGRPQLALNIRLTRLTRQDINRSSAAKLLDKISFTFADDDGDWTPL